ncbi:hypothetical protein [Antarcticirhabdus aurantiaca]|uniref:Uncharacterized protein n=1 Tax=Antarcticirhabdus aurantiaca TaxID=2606717 RepID=A0ACD4NRG3_9HYPH|nr:hypothetical protein [Antarcticirhabdus aurantiaca]WAJ29560.1 hypothetical protein OXU80_04815 [Jeongeuplla avenae]
MAEAHAVLGIPRHVLLALTRLGAIDCRQERNAKNGHLQTYVARDELDRFLKEYAPLSELATGAGVSPRLVKNRLKEADIEPGLDVEAALAVFYRRHDLPDLGSMTWVPRLAGRAVPR